MRTRSGLTLLEMLVALALIAMIYAIVGFTTIQLAHASRAGTAAARTSAKQMQACELLRWQLRGLYPLPNGACLSGLRTRTKGRDFVEFLTTHPRSGEGVVEVGYTVRSYRDGSGKAQVGLAYREFPYRDPKTGLRPDVPEAEGKWIRLCDDIVSLRLDYSADGTVWQREWTTTSVPREVKVTLGERNGGDIVFYVYPGVSSKRW